ncbi:hypothetical protein EV202_12719 [Bacteroides heparinolyticus]|uniref:Uncharacterized protein n=1 Tax=Prevotella heparinolytica TaxID=28113 RepID=A0A4R2LG17_9BACE|nr:hypothetical protein EV202_12719 [Bacteroides heparinolyticus]
MITIKPSADNLFFRTLYTALSILLRKIRNSVTCYFFNIKH